MTNLSDVVLRDLEHFYLMTKKEFERSDAETLNLNLDNNLGHGILLVDREWKNVFGNLTWEKISGYSKAETESKGFWDVFEEEEGLTVRGNERERMNFFFAFAFAFEQSTLTVPVICTCPSSSS